MSSLQEQQSSSSSSSSSPPSLVWFLLLDAATGQPYEGTTADKVSLSSSADVADFRDAVKKKDKDEGDAAILTPFKSSQLVVYKDKAAFDKRNAAVDEGKEEPLDPTESLGLLGSKEDMLVVVVPSSRRSSRSTLESRLTGKVPTDTLQSLTSFYLIKLEQLEEEIKALENSEEYYTLAKKNGAWVFPLLKEKLDEMKKKEDFYQEVILSTNAHSVKKSDKTRKKDTAIKDERLLLSDVAIKMWERFQFDCAFEDGPSFGDFKKAAGFRDDDDVRKYSG